ncbi:MAG: DUF2141 domain-containing protein [Phycisphaerales bacterium]
MPLRLVRLTSLVPAALLATVSMSTLATGCRAGSPAKVAGLAATSLEVTVVVPAGNDLPMSSASEQELRVFIGLVSEPTRWPGGPFDRRAIALLSDRGASARFGDLEPGRYAIVAFLDLDGDGELDRGAFGVPTEPVAYGNDTVPQCGPPAFGSGLVEVPTTGAAVEIYLRIR